jgi:hypothetical protein
MHGPLDDLARVAWRSILMHGPLDDLARVAWRSILMHGRFAGIVRYGPGRGRGHAAGLTHQVSKLSQLAHKIAIDHGSSPPRWVKGKKEAPRAKRAEMAGTEA